MKYGPDPVFGLAECGRRVTEEMIPLQSPSYAPAVAAAAIPTTYPTFHHRGTSAPDVPFAPQKVIVPEESFMDTSTDLEDVMDLAEAECELKFRCQGTEQKVENAETFRTRTENGRVESSARASFRAHAFRNQHYHCPASIRSGCGSGLGILADRAGKVEHGFAARG